MRFLYYPFSLKFPLIDHNGWTSCHIVVHCEQSSPLKLLHLASPLPNGLHNISPQSSLKSHELHGSSFVHLARPQLCPLISFRPAPRCCRLPRQPQPIRWLQRRSGFHLCRRFIYGVTSQLTEYWVESADAMPRCWLVFRVSCIVRLASQGMAKGS